MLSNPCQSYLGRTARAACAPAAQATLIRLRRDVKEFGVGQADKAAKKVFDVTVGIAEHIAHPRGLVQRFCHGHQPIAKKKASPFWLYRRLPHAAKRRAQLAILCALAADANMLAATNPRKGLTCSTSVLAAAT